MLQNSYLVAVCTYVDHEAGFSVDGVGGRIMCNICVVLLLIARSPLLLSKTPKPMHRVPAHWTTVDHFQDFELVELDSDNAEYDAVKQQFFSTMDVSEHDIVRVSRVQNPGLCDKYCR